MHEDNRLRTWNILDGKCMCVSLPRLFSARIEALQPTKLQRYFICISALCWVYVIDIITMKIIKIYTAGEQRYSAHVYMENLHALWVVDAQRGFFFWRLSELDEIKMVKKYNKGRTAENEVPKQMNPLATASIAGSGRLNALARFGDKDLLAVFDTMLYVMRDTGKQLGQELTQHAVRILGLSGTFVSASETDKQQSVALVSSARCLYFVAAKELQDQTVTDIRSKTVVRLCGEEFAFSDPRRVLYSPDERAVLALREYKQRFYVWGLAEVKEEGNAEVLAVVQRPWKVVARSEKSQVRLNTFLDRCGFFMNCENMCVFGKDEVVTANITHTSSDLSSPFYIVGTNMGNIFMFRIFMSDTRNIAPILLVEGHTAPVNQLCVKRDRLIAASVDGTVSITDLSPKKLQATAERYYQDRSDRPLSPGERFVQPYPESVYKPRLLPGGVNGFLEIHSLTREEETEINGFQLVGGAKANPVIEDRIAIVGCDNCAVIISLSNMNIVHTCKGLNSKVIGIYLRESINCIIVVTKSLTTYIYSAANRALERKVSGLQIQQILDIDDNIDKFLDNDNFASRYDDLFKLYSCKGGVLKSGSHHALDFCNSMDMMEMDWKSPGSRKELAYKVICNQVCARSRPEEVIVKIFNSVMNIRSKVCGKYERSSETGFASLHVRIGRENTKALDEVKHKYGAFKGRMKKSTFSSVVVLYLDEVLSHLQKNYKVTNKGPIFPMFDRNSSPKKERKEDTGSPIHSPQKERELKLEEVLAGSPTSGPSKIRADSLWPLPLISLAHCFGLNKKIDKDLGDEFCICPPLLQVWVGVPGVESTFSFAIPEVQEADWQDSQGLFNWKVSPYVNSVQGMMIFTSLVAIFHFNEQFIASVINRLLGEISRFLSGNAGMPYVSFTKLSQFMGSPDPDVWSTARDVILRPFLRKARPESFMNMAGQLGAIVEGTYAKFNADEPVYKKAIGLMKERNVMGRFDFLNLVNKHFGETEMRALSVLCYTFNEHYEQAGSVKTVGRCFKLSCFLVGYLRLR